MAAKKLGRGLDVLISRSTLPPAGPTRPASAAPGASPESAPPSAAPEPPASDGAPRPKSGAVAIPLDAIDPNPGQPRKSFSSKDLDELSASISQDGILQPILVRRRGDRYQLVAGERRYRAARNIPLETIPAIVVDADDRRVRELSLIENVQRTDLNPIELAEGYRNLIEQYGLKQDELAGRIGKKRPTITNTLRLLELPEEIQAGLARGDVSAGHAKILLSVETSEEQLRLFRRIRDQDMTVRDAEEEAAPARRKKRGKPRRDHPSRLHQLEERLTQALGTKVSVAQKDGRGTISIEFYSREELERLVEILTK